MQGIGNASGAERGPRRILDVASRHGNLTAVGGKVGIGGGQFSLSLLLAETTQDSILAMADTAPVSVGTVSWRERGGTMASTSPVSRFLPSQDLLLAGVVLGLHGHLASLGFRRTNPASSHLRRVSWSGGLWE